MSFLAKVEAASEEAYYGVNIQYPISQEILNGRKTVETRTYALKDHLIGKRMVFIETPGGRGNFKARMVAFITFKGQKFYKNEDEFYGDIRKHLVDRDSPYACGPDGKWGWIIGKIEKFKQPVPAPKNKSRSISKNIKVPKDII